MPTPSDEFREVRDPALDLRLMDRRPAEFRKWWEANRLTRALAHLLGFDGAKPQLLRCTSGGLLRVDLGSINGSAPAPTVAGSLPVRMSQIGTRDMVRAGDSAGSPAWLVAWDALAVAEPYAAVEVSLFATSLTTYDMNLPLTRWVVALTVDTGPVRVWGSPEPGGYTHPRGICAPGQVLLFPTSDRYLDMVNGGGDGFAQVLMYNLTAISD